jgi:hypothetical protein
MATIIHDHCSQLTTPVTAATTTIHSQDARFVIPGRASCADPESISRSWLWIPGSRFARAGMTNDGDKPYTGFPAYGIDAVRPPSTGIA